MTIDQMAQLATAVGLPIALASAIVAAATYVQSDTNARSAHAKAVFRDYQQSRLTTPAANPQFVSLKLYTLEELYEWTAHGRRAASLLPVPVIRRERLASWSAWEETIRTHAAYEFEETIANLLGNSGCYSDSFWSFLRRHPAFAAALPAGRGGSALSKQPVHEP